MFNRKYIINPGPFSIAMLVYQKVGFIGKFGPGNLEEAKSTPRIPNLSLHLPLLHSCKRLFCPKPFIAWEFFEGKMFTRRIPNYGTGFLLACDVVSIENQRKPQKKVPRSCFQPETQKAHGVLGGFLSPKPNMAMENHHFDWEIHRLKWLVLSHIFDVHPWGNDPILTCAYFFQTLLAKN